MSGRTIPITPGCITACELVLACSSILTTAAPEGAGVKQLTDLMALAAEATVVAKVKSKMNIFT